MGLVWLTETLLQGSWVRPWPLSVASLEVSSLSAPGEQNDLLTENQNSGGDGGGKTNK